LFWTTLGFKESSFVSFVLADTIFEEGGFDPAL
jgi:hypothetical protein